MSDAATLKSLRELLRSVPGASMSEPDAMVSDVVYDSRQVTPGALFVAMRGGYVDGHDYIGQAITRGAAALMVDTPGDYPVPTVTVPDSRAALSPVAAEFFGHPSRKLKVVGVTGTDGKTSTSTLAEAMIAASGHRTGLIGTVQIKIGDEIVDHETRQTTPESLDIQRMLSRMVDSGVSWALLEATSHGLAMHRLDDVQFEVAAVTNVTHEHIDFHGTREAYWHAKRQLFELNQSRGRGKAVINVDDPGAISMLDTCSRDSTLTYSQSDKSADVRAAGVDLGTHGFRSAFELPSGRLEVHSPLLGGFNVSNSLCATAIALHAGVSAEAIASTLANPPVISGRMARIDEGQAFTVVVDYAHTPASLEKVLTLLRTLDARGRIIVVTGSAGERDREKRPLQGAICARLADVSIFTNEDPRFEPAGEIIAEIAAGARSASGRPGASYFTIENRAEAIEHAVSIAQPGDTVLLAGKGHERSIILNGEKLPWDEAAVARAALRRRSRSEFGR